MHSNVELFLTSPRTAVVITLFHRTTKKRVEQFPEHGGNGRVSSGLVRLEVKSMAYDGRVSVVIDLK